MNYSNEEQLVIALEHVEAMHEFPENLSRNIKMQLIAEDLVSVYEDIVIISNDGIKYLSERAEETFEMQDLAEDSDYKALYLEEEYEVIEELEIDNGSN